MDHPSSTDGPLRQAASKRGDWTRLGMVAGPQPERSRLPFNSNYDSDLRFRSKKGVFPANSR